MPTDCGSLDGRRRRASGPPWTSSAVVLLAPYLTAENADELLVAAPATIPGDSWAILTTRPGAGWRIFTATEGDFALSAALRPPAHHEPEHPRQAAPRAGVAEPPGPLPGPGGWIRSRARCPDRKARPPEVRQGPEPRPG